MAGSGARANTGVKRARSVQKARGGSAAPRLKGRPAGRLVAKPGKARAPRLRPLPPSLPLGPVRPRGRGGALVIGADEAGRGPWAGPVVAAAVALGPVVRGLERGVTDSKRLAEAQRERVYEALTGNPGVHWSVALVGPARIDKVNILRASMEAMARAVRRIPGRVHKVFIDGPHVPGELAEHSCEAVIGGDRKNFAIAAASIIAKVTRDRLMMKLDRKHPQYGFKSHKGYGTAVHHKAIKRHGVLREHRRSYEPVRRLLSQGRGGRQGPGRGSSA
uniref:Ribonuclease n=1 Tax=Alexandrium monilatum TaxID=311494 RepID=A0A7S4RFM7_9DINO